MAMKGVNLRLGAVNKGGAAMSSYQKGLKGIRSAQRSVSRSSGSFMKGMNANRRIIQQVGFQVSDLGVQIAGGQSAILSLTQNVPQVVQMFGAWGGILAALITLFGTFTLVMIKSGKGINDIVPFAGALQDEFEGLVRVLGMLKNATFDTLNLLINNLDVLLLSLTVLAAFMTGRFIFSFLKSTGTLRLFNVALLVTKRRGIGAGLALLKARGGALLFAGALKIVKKALVLTGIGTLIVGIGYLTERLMTLTEATGSWGKTWALVGDLVKQSLMQIPAFFLVLQARQNEMTSNMSAAWREWLGTTVGLMPDWADSVVSSIVATARAGVTALQGTYAIFQSLQRGDATTAAAIGAALGAGVKKSFDEAINKNYVGKEGSLTKRLMGDASDARETAANFKKIGDALLKGATDAIPAWTQIKALLASIEKPDFDIRDILGKSDIDKEAIKQAKKFQKFLDRMKGVVRRTREQQENEEKRSAASFQKFLDRMKGIVRKHRDDEIDELNKKALALRNKWRDGFQDMFRGLITGATSLKDTVNNVLNSIANRLADMATNSIFDAIFGKPGTGFFSSILGGGSGGGGFFKKFLGSIFSFNGGGFTGKGSRSGGVDGKGGFPAILHPNETVIDHTKHKNADGDMSRIAMGYTNDNGQPPVTITNHNYFNGVTREEMMRDVEASQKQLKRQIDGELPGRINKHTFNRNRGVA